MHVKIRLLKPHEHLLLHSYVLRLLCCTSYLTKARVTSHVAKMSPRLRDTCNSTDDSAKIEKVWPWEKGSFGNELAPKKKNGTSPSFEGCKMSNVGSIASHFECGKCFLFSSTFTQQRCPSAIMLRTSCLMNHSCSY